MSGTVLRPEGTEQRRISAFVGLSFKEKRQKKYNSVADGMVIEHYLCRGRKRQRAG